MASNTGKMKKQDMVAAAIAGGKAKPTEGVAFVLERFGVTMTPDSFSQSKKTLAKKSKLDGGAPREAPAPTRAPAAGPATHKNGKRSPAELARQVKSLVAEHGADEVAAMLAVFKE